MFKAIRWTGHHHCSCPSCLWERQETSWGAFGHGQRGCVGPQAPGTQRAPAADVGRGGHFGKGRPQQRVTATGQRWLPTGQREARLLGTHRGEAPPEEQAQWCRRTRISWKELQNESESNDEIAHPTQRKCSAPGRVHVAWPAWPLFVITFRNSKYVNVLICHAHS